MDKLQCENDSSAPKKEKFSKVADLEILELSKHEQELEAQKTRHKVSREKIVMLESKIRQLKESHLIANILKEKKVSPRVKQPKKPRIDQLMSRRVTLQQELNLNQDENRRREEELGKRKANLKDRIQNGNLQLTKAKKKLAKITQLGNRLLDTTREVRLVNLLDQKIKETTDSITKKQAKLVLKKKRETELIQLTAEREMQETQLGILDKQIKWIRNEKEVQEMTEREMTKVLSILKDEKDDLKAQLCHEKNQLMIQRFQLLKNIENFKKENEDDERTIEVEEIELKIRMETVAELETKISMVDAPKKKKK